MKSEKTSLCKEKQSSHKSRQDKKLVFIFFLISHSSHLFPFCTLFCVFQFFFYFCLVPPTQWNVFLANFLYLPETLFPYDEFRSYFPKKMWAPRRKALFCNEAQYLSKPIKLSHLKVKKKLFFSPFPQPPAFDPAWTLLQSQVVWEARQNFSKNGQKYIDKINPTTGKYFSTPRFCVVAPVDILSKLAGLAESIDYRVNRLLQEQKAIAEVDLEHLRDAESFARPLTKRNGTKDKRDVLGNVALILPWRRHL